MTTAACVEAAARTLAAAGFAPDDARIDAGVLARHVLGWTLTEWAAGARDEAPARLVARLDPLIRRRALREPVAYITGTREFYGREFRVTPAVLIPRPETELIPDVVRDLDLPASAAIADVGTGSGCLAITLALECPAWHVTATDTSPAALDVARVNAKALGAGRITFVEASLVPPESAPLDLIVSNPPYVPGRDRGSLAPDVRDFEPASALFGGEDGLDVIRALVPAAADALAAGGWLVLEIGAGQAEAVTAIVDGAGLVLQRISPDLHGIPRVVAAQSRRDGARGLQPPGSRS